MRRIGKAVLWFFAGLVLGWIAVAALGLTYMNVAGMHDRDGGGSMGVIFILGPAIGIVCGLIAAGLAVARGPFK